MKFVKSFLFFQASLIFVSSLAIAGQESHGGNIVICPGKETVILDYYHSTLADLGGNKPRLVDLKNFTANDVISFIKKRIANRGYFDSELSLALQKVGPMESWLSADLKSVDDSSEPYVLPPTCELRTAAIRQDNATMFGDPARIGLLSLAQRGLLIVHEAAYLVASNHGQTNSANVRTLMRELLRMDGTQDNLDAAIRGIGADTATPTWTIANMPVGVYSDASGYQLDGKYYYAYLVSIDHKTQHVRIDYSEKDSLYPVSSNQKNLTFVFDASSLIGRETSSSQCGYSIKVGQTITGNPKPQFYIYSGLNSHECKSIALAFAREK